MTLLRKISLATATNILLLFNITVSGQDIKQTIRITNLENRSGTLYIGWFKDAATFRIANKAVYRERITITNQKEIGVDFKNIPAGKYAISVYLDENNNNRFDKNILGIPKEKYGFSNNILPRFRAASFEESVFDLTKKENIITIKLK